MKYDSTSSDYDYFEDSTAEEPEAGYQVNRDLNLAHRIVEETGANLFLTGKAGTGKTTFLRRLRQTSKKRMIVLAPTGVAAINAEGSTIHSFFQLSFSPFVPGRGFVGEERRKYSFNKEKRRIIASLDLLVIDEISMVRPDTLDAIDSVMRRYRNPALPFGGVQLLLIGDLRQLAPVVKDDERQILAPYYPSEYFFESHALRQSGFATIELSTIYRQSDRDFILVLNAVRDGMITPQTLEALNRRHNPSFAPDDEEGYIRLTTHNRMADEINYRRLAFLRGEGAVYNAKVTGDFPESAFPADFSLHLKIGAQVMFIKNDSGQERAYYNGMLGTVTNLSVDWVTVTPADGGPAISVNPVQWENTRYVIDEDSKQIIQITDGTFTQLPLRLAWAITIHKSQGLTFDKAIIDAGASFAPGQTYVALSRCRSLEGLVLGQPITYSSVIVDGKVNDFIARSQEERPSDSDIEVMRADYTRFILSDLFDFRATKVAFEEFHHAVSEYVAPLYPEYYAPFRDAERVLSREIDQIGAKFSVMYASSPILPEHLEAHPDFLEKIRNGCHYFLPLLKQVKETVDSVDVNLQNSAYAKRLTNAYENVSYQLGVKIGVLKGLADIDFSPGEYIKVKAEAVVEASAPSKKEKKRAALSSDSGKKENVKKEKKTKEKKEKRPVGYSKRLSFDLFNQGQSIDQIASDRGLAESTIAGHIAEFVKDGELAIDKVLSQESIDLLHEAFVSGATVAEVREMLNDKLKNYEISLYYYAQVKQ